MYIFIYHKPVFRHQQSVEADILYNNSCKQSEFQTATVDTIGCNSLSKYGK